jgi:hypothetical protein
VAPLAPGAKVGMIAMENSSFGINALTNLLKQQGLVDYANVQEGYGLFFAFFL